MTAVSPEYANYCDLVGSMRNSVSPESVQLRSWIKDIRDGLEAISSGVRRQLKDEILDVFRERQLRGWDGYNADPITEEFCGAAVKFIDLLPEGLLAPDVVAEPTGRIGFEWMLGKEKRLSISPASFTIEYAALIGSEKQFGDAPFLDEIPKTIETILREHFAKA